MSFSRKRGVRAFITVLEKNMTLCPRVGSRGGGGGGGGLKPTPRSKLMRCVTYILVKIFAC